MGPIKSNSLRAVRSSIKTLFRLVKWMPRSHFFSAQILGSVSGAVRLLSPLSFSSLLCFCFENITSSYPGLWPLKLISFPSFWERKQNIGVMIIYRELLSKIFSISAWISYGHWESIRSLSESEGFMWGLSVVACQVFHLPWLLGQALSLPGCLGVVLTVMICRDRQTHESYKWTQLLLEYSASLRIDDKIFWRAEQWTLADITVMKHWKFKQSLAKMLYWIISTFCLLTINFCSLGRYGRSKRS